MIQFPNFRRKLSQIDFFLFSHLCIYMCMVCTEYNIKEFRNSARTTTQNPKNVGFGYFKCGEEGDRSMRLLESICQTLG